MKRKIDSNEIAKWRESVGGLSIATRLIMQELSCSPSKAEKIASGKYPSVPSTLEQLALAALLKKSRDVVFPVIGKSRARAS
jgi:hypothetical protein